jgi:hypothetical protein
VNFETSTGRSGNVELRLTNGGKNIDVQWIGGRLDIPADKNVRPQDLGAANTRALLKQLHDKYPTAETITGFRVSGARSESGSRGEAWMKFPSSWKKKD